MNTARIVLIIPVSLDNCTPHEAGVVLSQYLEGMPFLSSSCGPGCGFTVGEVSTFKVSSEGESGRGALQNPQILLAGCRQGEAMFDGLDGHPDLIPTL